MVRVVSDPVAGDLAVNPGATSFGALVLLENDDRRSLTHHESVAILVKGTRCGLWFFVACRHRANEGEGSEAEWRERRFCSAGDHYIRIAIAYLPECIANGDRPRRAAHGIGGVRTHDTELDRDVAARCASENRECQRRIDGANTLLEIHCQLTLRVADAAQRGTHVRADALFVFLG